MKRIPEIIIFCLILACATVFAGGSLSVVSVTSSQTLLSAARLANTSVTLANLGTNTVFLKYDSGATTNNLSVTNGIPLLAGAVVTFANDSGFAAARNNIYGISSNANNVSVTYDDAK